MKNVTFHSSLASPLADFVTFKRMQGYDYTHKATQLGYFDAFLTTEHFTLEVLTREIVDCYVATTAKLKPQTRIGMLSPVRGFSRYLNTLHPQSWVMREYPFNVPRVIRFYLYSPADIAALLKAIRRPGLTRTMSPECLHFLIGLLYTTGLRINEALSLTLGNVDLHHRTLFVRKGKFGKDRYVILHPTTADHLCRWLTVRSKAASQAQSAPLLVNVRGERLLDTNVRKAFARCVRTCRIGEDAPTRPRLHDLRHTDACNCVMRWRRLDLDVNAMLPILTTALGHVSIHHTQVYLHATSAQLNEAARKFRYIFQ